MSYFCYAAVDPLSKLDLITLDSKTKKQTNKQTNRFQINASSTETAQGTAGTEGLLRLSIICGLQN